MLGQASGGFTESSSALRILHLGVRNTVGVLTDDAFTQANPVSVTAAGTTSTQVDTTVLGVLSGSAACTRPDAGDNFIGGPIVNDDCQVLGFFINTANGNSYENTPGTASGKGPYVSSQGCYANNLFETEQLTGGGAGTDLTYSTGQTLVVSSNGFLTNSTTAADAHDVTNRSEAAGEVVAICKMPADATQDEIVYDQRI